MLEQMIIDADLCIKLGSSDKYHFLLEVLPVVAKKIYMHSHAFGEAIIKTMSIQCLYGWVTGIRSAFINHIYIKYDE